MSQTVAQRGMSRRQTAEETARDRLRATLHTGGPETEGAPDVAGRADATAIKNDMKPHQARSMRTSSRGTPAQVPDETRLARRKTRREPQHVASKYPQTPPKELAAVEQNHRASHPRLEHQRGKEDHATRTQKTGANRKRIYCGNNALAHELTSGQAVVGKRSECFRKGVGGGLHAKIPPGGMDEFIAKWTAPYRKLYEQNLHYGDGPTPAGKIPATLSQCLARGFAVGSIRRAKEEMHNRS